VGSIRQKEGAHRKGLVAPGSKNVTRAETVTEKFPCQLATRGCSLEVFRIPGSSKDINSSMATVTGAQATIATWTGPHPARPVEIPKETTREKKESLAAANQIGNEGANWKNEMGGRWVMGLADGEVWWCPGENRSRPLRPNGLEEEQKTGHQDNSPSWRFGWFTGWPRPSSRAQTHSGKV